MGLARAAIEKSSGRAKTKGNDFFIGFDLTCFDLTVDVPSHLIMNRTGMPANASGTRCQCPRHGWLSAARAEAARLRKMMAAKKRGATRRLRNSARHRSVSAAGEA